MQFIHIETTCHSGYEVGYCALGQQTAEAMPDDLSPL
jgi:hypothetical protein